MDKYKDVQGGKPKHLLKVDMSAPFLHSGRSTKTFRLRERLKFSFPRFTDTGTLTFLTPTQSTFRRCLGFPPCTSLYLSINCPYLALLSLYAFFIISSISLYFSSNAFCCFPMVFILISLSSFCSFSSSTSLFLSSTL